MSGAPRRKTGRVNIGRVVYTSGKTWAEMTDRERVEALTGPGGYVEWIVEDGVEVDEPDKDNSDPGESDPDGREDPDGAEES